MPSTTVGGGIGEVNFPTSTQPQTALAQQVLAAAVALATTATTVAGGTVNSSTMLALSQSGGVFSGAASVPSALVGLDGSGLTYITNAAPSSTVVSADGSNSTVINNSPNSVLNAATGAGPNVLAGFAGTNAFVTGLGGQDVAYLDGASNSLQSNGSDAILINGPGPSTITAASFGVDNIVFQSAATLYFINGLQTGSVDSVTGTAGGTIVVAGTGSTSINSGVGPENFYVDTSSGNTTLNAKGQVGDAFYFVKNAAGNPVAGSVIDVSQFAVGDTVSVHGYSGYTVTALAGNPSGSTLALSDGSKVTFDNVSTTTLQGLVKTV